MTQTILVINPGSTSTKVAVFEDKNLLFSESVAHSEEELRQFSWVMDQLDFRTKRVDEILARHNFDMSRLTCVMSRGGMVPPCASGAYRITPDMLKYVYAQTIDTHISNVGCAIADAIARRTGIPAFIYDPVTVDELSPIARITGFPELPKVSRGHALIRTPWHTAALRKYSISR